MLLTTHYMAEADELCDRIAIIDRGQLLACDTPRSALKQAAERRADVRARDDAAGHGRWTACSRACQACNVTHRDGDGRTFARADASRRSRCSARSSRRWHRAGSACMTLATRETALEDVFIAIVGRGLEDGGDVASIPSTASVR